MLRPFWFFIVATRRSCYQKKASWCQKFQCFDKTFKGADGNLHIVPLETVCPTNQYAESASDAVESFEQVL